MDEAFPQQASAEAEKVEIAAEFAEAFDAAAERHARFELQKRAQPAFGADVSRRKHVEPPQTTQQHEPCAPRPDARQLDQGPQRIAARHAGDPFFSQFARFDRPAQSLQRFSLACAQAACAQRLPGRPGNCTSGRECMEPPAGVLVRLAKALDHSSDDGHACLQAHLLERHHVHERLEQLDESRWSQATKRERGEVKRRVGHCQPQERPRVDIEPEQPAKRPPCAGKRRRPRIAGSDGEPNVRIVDCSAVFHLDQNGGAAHRQHTQVAPSFPEVDAVRWPSLQDARRRLEVEWRLGRECRSRRPCARGSASVRESRRRNYRILRLVRFDAPAFARFAIGRRIRPRSVRYSRRTRAPLCSMSRAL